MCVYIYIFNFYSNLRLTHVGQLPLMSGFQKFPSGWQRILALGGA